MSIVKVNGIELYYEQQGEGIDIVFLHGLGSGTRDWEMQFDGLRDRFRVTAFDMRGHGQSAKPPGPYSLREMGQDIAYALEALEIERAYLCGLSLGGMAAQWVPLLKPERVAGLILSNTTAAIAPDNVGDHLRVLIRKLSFRFSSMETIGGVIADSLFPFPHQKEWNQTVRTRWMDNDRKAYLQAFYAALRHDARSALAQVQCPVLVLAGELDKTIPEQYQQELVAAFPKAEYIQLKDSGHASPIDAAEVFNSTIAEFILRCEASR